MFFDSATDNSAQSCLAGRVAQQQQQKKPTKNQVAAKGGVHVLRQTACVDVRPSVRTARPGINAIFPTDAIGLGAAFLAVTLAAVHRRVFAVP